MDDPHDPAPVEGLAQDLYDALRDLARRALGSSRYVVDPTEVVHEAFLRLARSDAYGHMTRPEFLALCSTVIRRLLVDLARRGDADRRGGGWRRITMSDLPAATADGAFDLVDLDGALAKLAELDDRQARIVELRFFGGMTGDEVADLLGLSRRMVTREWMMARAWLKRELER